MKGPFLLLLVLLALMATFARADAPQEETLVAKVQALAQEAAQKAQEHLATIRDSQAAQQARELFETGLEQTQQYLSLFKDQLTALWEKATAST